MALTSFLSKEEQQKIVKAIEVAEKYTSGEIRVHVEPRCKLKDPYERAVEVFNTLEMYKTEQRNGALVYVAYRSHQFAIIGDSGINEKVKDTFWDKEKEKLAEKLKSGQACEGLCEVVKLIGENLAEYFPCEPDDKNELSNEISYDSQNE